MNDRIMQYILEAGTDCSGKWMSLFQAEKLAELIIEECAKRTEAYSYMSPNFTALAEELRRMNGVE